MNGSEYLEFVKRKGLKEKNFTPVQPVSQHRIWEKVVDFKPFACDEALKKLAESGQSLNLDRASWTNDRSWAKGYEKVLDPINKLSAAFHEKYSSEKIDSTNKSYQEALLYLLLSQTSCFRYWGEGIWTEYAKEICRRGMEALSR